MKWRRWLVAMLIGIAVLTGSARAVHGESASVKVFLYYMPNVSNYGPTGATGVAIFNAGNGDLTIDADGLPLVAGLAYEVWLSVSSEPVAMTSFGKFNPGPNGTVHYYQVVDDLLRAEYRFIIITVETDPDPSPAPSARRTIAGVIPDVAALVPTPTPQRASTGQSAPGATAVPTDSSPASHAPVGPATPPPPARLPTTGAETPIDDPLPGWLALAGISLATLFLFARGRHA
ncbi:MAG: hypothetical protein HZB53_04335 [Chloroflexi bacterium]|nr:hypothetical protein [Chloroflexota bacterium]